MKLLDCTLRDGANVVGNGFSGELTESIVKNLLECGIRDIEFGNAKGLGAHDRLNSVAPLTDLEYMRLVSPYVDKGNLGMFVLAGCATDQNIRMAAENGLQFLRIGTDTGNGENAVSAIRAMKKTRLTCRYSMMKAYVSSPKKLAEEAKLLEDAGVDIITIMDSAGTMLPSDVEHYVTELKSKLSIPVGFHGHNNLGLSQANALAAVIAGVDEIDCGLLGMARSVGNCSTEQTIAIMQRQGMLKHVDFYKLLDYLDCELIPTMKNHGYYTVINPVDLILGLSGCHSSFLDLFESIAKKEKVSLYRLIVAVSAVDQKVPTETLIYTTAKKLL